MNDEYVRCPVPGCGSVLTVQLIRRYSSLRYCKRLALANHLHNVHPELSVRQRSLYCDQAAEA